MKIFNVENGKEKVYVQMNDIMMLNRTDVPIPASIFDKVFTDTVIVDNSNRMDFVEFTEPHEIAFFRKRDWIIDYKEIRDLSEAEITAKGEEISKKMNEIAESFNAMSQEQRMKNHYLKDRFELLEYKLNYLAEILWVKQGKKSMPFPIVPDSDGFCFVGDENHLYEMRASLNPNKLLIYRKDGKELKGSDIIPREFIQAGMSIAIMTRQEKDEFFGDFTVSNSLSADRKYLINEFSVTSYGEKSKEIVSEQNTPKGIKKLIKKWFNKKDNQDKK